MPLGIRAALPNSRLDDDVPITAACPQTPQHADHAQSRARNGVTFQLRQPTVPESRVRGVVGGCLFGDQAESVAELPLT